MEKNKGTKETTSKKTNTFKKTVSKTVDNKKTKKKKGFTLIELLAVIIILGILMIIAIPSVTKYISDSRKSAYVDTAKEIISGARNLVNEGKLGMYDTNVTYYIPASYIRTENASKSPYGEFTEAYVVVIYDGKGYKYYWISTDDAGQGISKITSNDKLDSDSIESDLTDLDISNVVETTGVGSRERILILNPNTNEWREVDGGAKVNITEDTGEAIKRGLTLANSSGTALCGRQLVIEYTTDGDGTISCTSSNTSIATCSVYNNRITIRSNGTGTATITINQAASTNGIEASSLTYTFTTEGTCSWHYHKNYSSSGGAQICWIQCESYCRTTYNAYLSSCLSRSSGSTTFTDGLENGPYCWCKY